MNKAKESKLRQRLRVAYHEDGILDLVVGLSVLLFSLVMAFEANAFVGMVGIPIVFYFPLKDQITHPRRGLIRFDSAERSQLRLGLILALGLLAFLTVAGLVFLGGGLARSATDLLVENGAYLLAGAMGLGLWLTGYLLSNRRFGYYALLGLAGISLLRLGGLASWIGVAVLGGVMLATGSIYLMRFVRRYPASGEEREP